MDTHTWVAMHSDYKVSTNNGCFESAAIICQKHQCIKHSAAHALISAHLSVWEIEHAVNPMHISHYMPTDEAVIGELQCAAACFNQRCITIVSTDCSLCHHELMLLYERC